MSIQGLIDFLRAVQDQGLVAQIALLSTFIGLPILGITRGTRGFRRRYHDIEEENDQLKAQKEANKERLDHVRQACQALQKEQDKLQGRLPEVVLEIADWEVHEGNDEIAYRKLKGMFDDLSPGLSNCFVRLSEHASAAGPENATDRQGPEARHFRQLAQLLRTVTTETTSS